jgi:hypothetical protein
LLLLVLLLAGGLGDGWEFEERLLAGAGRFDVDDGPGAAGEDEVRDIDEARVERFVELEAIEDWDCEWERRGCWCCWCEGCGCEWAKPLSLPDRPPLNCW